MKKDHAAALSKLEKEWEAKVKVASASGGGASAAEATTEDESTEITFDEKTGSPVAYEWITYLCTREKGAYQLRVERKECGRHP